jgi:predicted membrane-bound spermidine synthase
MSFLPFVFLLSGASALLFETLWFRQAGLMLGNTVWASALVTSSFMAGLALGNGAAARREGRVERPLLLYAVLELLVGLSGVGLVLLFPSLTRLLAPALRLLLPHPALLNATRLAAAFVLLLAPATAMGMTLPVLVHALRAREPDFGRALGRLYGWNTLGAVLGALLGEGVLVRTIGVRGTGLCAAGLDVLAALLASGLAARMGAPAQAAADEPVRPLGGEARRILAAAFVAGGILLALEVVWFRFLQLVVEPSALAFAVMLSVVLLGIAAGGLAADAWLKWQPRAFRLASLVALGGAVAVTTTYARLRDAIVPYPVVLHEPLQVWTISLHLMLPVCLLSGVLFTLLGKSLQETIGGGTRPAGLLTLWNTVGAALGALAAGFLLLPRVGMEASFFLLSCAYVAAALLVARLREWRTPGFRREGYAAAALFACAVLLLALFPFGLVRFFVRRIATIWTGDGSKVVLVREGLTETVIYLRKDLLDEPVHYRLATNSFSMSSTAAWAKRYMKLFVYWPLALHPNARHALLISYGMGSTAKALTDAAQLESIDVVDPSRDILDASRVVYPQGKGPLDDPRVRVHLEDGRFFLLTTDQTFDLITGEPPPPKNAGIVNLYTRQYFSLMHERLAPGGLATYWLPLDQLDLKDAQAVTAGFCDAFEDCSLWAAQGTDWMLAGSRGERRPVTAEEFGRLWRDPAMIPGLREIAFEGPEQIGATFVADARTLREWLGSVPPLDDDHPGRLSYALPSVIDPAFPVLSNPDETRRRFAESAFCRRLWPASLWEPTLSAFDEMRVVHRIWWSPPGTSRVPWLRFVLEQTGRRTLVYWLLHSSVREQEIAARAAQQGSTEPIVEVLKGYDALAARDYLATDGVLGRVQSRAAEPERVAELRMLALCLAGRPEPAAEVARQASESLHLRDADVWSWLKTTCPR